MVTKVTDSALALLYHFNCLLISSQKISELLCAVVYDPEPSLAASIT